ARPRNRNGAGPWWRVRRRQAGEGGRLLAAAPSGSRSGVVDELGDAGGEVRLLLRRLVRRDRPGFLGRVDLGRRVRDERVEETVTVLIGGRVRDLRQRLAGAQLGFEVLP